MNSTQNKNNEESIDLEKNNSDVNKIDEESLEDGYKFGWNNYSETTNGRFAMLGLIAIIVIELISKRSFLDWSGIIN